jgi:hypothetical protein
MKKIFFILIVLISIPNVKAQKKINFGVKTAYSFTDWKWNIYPEPSVSGSGLTLGGFVDYNVLEKGWLKAEVDYSKYNFNLSENNGYDVTFLEFPITFNVKLQNRIYSYFGLGLGFKMSDATYWMSSDETLSQIPILKDYKPEYLKSTNVFFPVGVSYIFDFGMFIDLRMNLNINDMSNSSVEFAKGLNTYNVGLGMNF